MITTTAWHFKHARETKGYIKKLVGQLGDDYDVALDLRIKPNTSRTYHRKQGNMHLLVFGLMLMHEFWRDGHHEYKSIAWVWGKDMGATGMQAVHNTALHEFAHVLQTERYQRKRGSVHNTDFVRCLQELIEKYPYKAEVKPSRYTQITKARRELNQMFA